jgi:hypothetical protein
MYPNSNTRTLISRMFIGWPKQLYIPFIGSSLQILSRCNPTVLRNVHTSCSYIHLGEFSAQFIPSRCRPPAEFSFVRTDENETVGLAVLAPCPSPFKTLISGYIHPSIITSISHCLPLNLLQVPFLTISHHLSIKPHSSSHSHSIPCPSYPPAL